MPWIWLVAGPNGSGKSTFAKKSIIAQLPGAPLKKLNADEISQSIRLADGSLSQAAADLEAVRAVDMEVAKLVERRESFLVETVLSSDKYKATVVRARELDYSIGFVFVTLISADLNVARVRLRVRRGGHDVPPKTIVKRWDKSLHNLPWFAERADIVYIYDNSGVGREGAELIAEKPLGKKLRLVKPGINPRVDAELCSLIH